MVGIAFTMRFIPSREDKDGPNSKNRSTVQPQAMEECPPGHVLMIDSRGDSRAASAGDLYVGRLKARGAAGIVTDGGFRDTDGVFKTGLPAYHRRPSSPPSPIAHRPVDLQAADRLRRRRGLSGRHRGGDRDAVLVIPPDIVEAVAQEALNTYSLRGIRRGRGGARPLAKGLFPVAGEEAKRDYEAWKKRGERVGAQDHRPARSASCRPDLQPALQGQRHRRALGDVGHALLLLVVDAALDGEHAVDVLLVALAHEMHVGMHRRHRPLLALGIHAERDHGAAASAEVSSS